MTDAMLVNDFARTRSPAALAELAERHAGWVYSAALRMVGDADLAQDVAQAVFLVLVRKAATLQGRHVNAWLFGVTRFAAKHALRERARRKHHERLAITMLGRTAQDQTQNAWLAMAPLLDELVGRLNPRDRRAVLLRFYEARTMAQVGIALGISQDAAKKRVAKAVRRLRELFRARDINVPSDALSALMLTHATAAAPPALVAVCAAPRASAASAAASISAGVISMMALAKLKVAAVAVLALGLIPVAVALALQASAQPPPSAPSAPAGVLLLAEQPDDAVPIYIQANAAIKVDSPAATAMVYPKYPPDSPAWMDVAAQAWNADGRARDLAHQALSINHANWPTVNQTGQPGLNLLNAVRNLANNLGDAALYADIQGNTAQALSIIRDLRHLSDLLLNSPSRRLVHMLVGEGISALMSNRLEIIICNVKLIDDPANHQALQVQDAYELIAELEDHTDPQTELIQTYNLERIGMPIANDQTKKAIEQILDPSLRRALETNQRVTTEMDLAAMSLAAHIFKFEKGRWPNSLEEMIPSFLPAAIIDPWGDGKQTLGYVLIKGGLPDGSDRPMVYSRATSSDGLEYPANQIEFEFYSSDRGRKGYGQFRDVQLWQPNQNYVGPEYIPLPPDSAAPAVRPTGLRIGPGNDLPGNRVLE